MADGWYYFEGGQQRGPVSDGDLKELAATGQLGPGDLIWKAGMPQWLKACDARGIFPEPQIGPMPHAPASSYPPQLPARPAQTLPREARPPSVPARGRSGLKIALILGSVLVVLLVVVGGIALIMRATSKTSNPPPFNYTLQLAPNQNDVRAFRLQRNMFVTIRVQSDQQSDVDLVVLDQFGRKVAEDIRPDPSCLVQFRPARTENFRIEITNVGDGPNRCRVHIEQRNR